MRIAILMHGITGGTDKFGIGKSVPLELSHGHLKQHVLDVNEDHDIDIFMHSWSEEDKEELLKIYEPVRHVIEPQIIFNFKYTVGDPNKKGNPFDKAGAPNRADFGYYYGQYQGLDNLRFHSFFSRWYSAKAVNDLKINYEVKNGFKYDFVFLTRYDLAYLEDIKFSDYDKEKFYVIGPDNPGIGYNDLWFFSDSEKMNHFCTLYDGIKTIGCFQNKHHGNHFFAREWANYTGLSKHVEFIFNRPWDSYQTKKDQAEGRDVGPSPPIRRWYDLEVPSPHGDMQKLREHIIKTSKRTISS